MSRRVFDYLASAGGVVVVVVLVIAGGLLTWGHSFVNDNVQLLTVSVDSPYSHKVWADREGYRFPLLADFWPHGAVAQAYGVFNAERGFANRGTFLIDKDGVVRFAEMISPGERRDQDGWRKAVAALAG